MNIKKQVAAIGSSDEKMLRETMDAQAAQLLDLEYKLADVNE